MNLTPAQVKNLMRRGLRFLIDPEPDSESKKLVRDYFGNRCAYCDRPTPPGEGDIDHLISAALGGANGLANRVLSCKPCNAQEKRHLDWKEFLKRKCAEQKVFEQRTLKIDSWVQRNGGHPVLDKELLALLESEAKRTTTEYDIACKAIKAKACG